MNPVKRLARLSAERLSAALLRFLFPELAAPWTGAHAIVALPAGRNGTGLLVFACPCSTEETQIPPERLIVYRAEAD
ncbi:TPA: hypothetical protein ACGSTF_004718 [Pseudomonas aeruginosa]